MKDRKDLFGIGLAVALLGGLCVGVAPGAAQEPDEDRRRREVQFSFSGGGGYLGVEIADVEDERASELEMDRPHGVYIVNTIDGEAAAEAGIEDGDVILAWNGERLESVAQLRRLTGETPSGRSVDLTVLRDGRELELTVELGSRSGFARGGGSWTVISPQVDVERVRDLARVRVREAEVAQERARELYGRVREAHERADEAGRAFYLPGLPSLGFPSLGANTWSLGDQLAEYFGVEDGVLVTSVHEDTPAAEGGLLAGDVIVRIGDDHIGDQRDLREALAHREPGDVSIRIVRDGAAQTLTVEVAEREGSLRWPRGIEPR